MQAAIRETCLSCGICSQYLSERPQEPMKSYEIANRPWSRVSADIFQLAGNNYPVMVDHYSDFFELDSLRNTKASTVIRAMKRNFARHGIPDECITGNGPQFVFVCFPLALKRGKVLHNAVIIFIRALSCNNYTHLYLNCIATHICR